MTIGWKRKGVAAGGNGEAAGSNVRSANPYLDARREWNSQTERAFSQLHVWQLIAIAGLLVGLAGVAGITYVGSKSKYVPYVIEVDKLGEALAIGPAELAAPADPRIVRFSLASFIGSARLVTPDLQVQDKAAWVVFGMLKTKDPATAKMQEWLNLDGKNAPRERAKKVMVNTDVASVLPVSATSWQVDWMESTRDRDGNLIGAPVHMRAVLQVYIIPPNTDANERDLKLNPLGIYVQDFNWQSL